MATFTITVANTNIDSLTSKAGDDTYNVNGGSLVVDQDTRGGLNNDTSSIMGAVTASATLAGDVNIDGRYVRLIPYNTGSGNVPAWNTTITQGSASGKLIAVYSALNVASTATGAAMPASGYIKIKAWNETPYAAGALTGIGATATGADTVGWIEVVGTETPRNWTFNRLNNPSTPVVQGSWYEVGTTDGNRATTYQIPSNGVNQYHGGVWVQKAASATITAASYSAGVVTFTATAHGFATGDRVITQNILPHAYQRLVDSSAITVTGANTFTMTYQSDPGTYTSGGTAYPIEFYPASSDTFVSTNISTSALKGKFCSISTAGLVRFGHDGTNSSGGYIVPTGMKVFMPNVFLTGATIAAKTQNSYNATTSTRPRWIVTGAGRLDIRNCSSNFGFGSISGAQYFRMQDSSMVDNIAISNVATAPILSNVGVGGQFAYNVAFMIAITAQITGISMIDFIVGRSGQGSTALAMISPTDCTDMVFTRCKLLHTGSRGSASQFAVGFSRVARVTFTNCVISHGLNGSSTTNVSSTGMTYFDSNGGSNLVANTAMYMINVSTQSNDWTIDGVTIADGDLPRNGLASVASSSARFTLKNVGTRSSPIGTGLYEEAGASWTRATTTATVTTASAHGLTTGDFIEVYVSSNIAAITRQSVAVTVTSGTTFTFTCLNAGGASGTLSYYPVFMARLYLMTNVDTVKFQNIHIRGIRSALYSTDNTSKNVYHENVSSNWQDQGGLAPTANNTYYYGSSISPINPGATSAVYGDHIMTGYTAETTIPNGSGVAWTRSAAVITVTKTNHGMVTGQKILVTTSDNQVAIIPAATVQVTVLTKDTFTFTGTNSGTTSGNLSYFAADGLMLLQMNESNTVTSSYVTLGGAAAFTGAGSIAMFAVNDTLTLETERYIYDFDSAENVLPFMSGGALSNYDVTYDIDTGSGYSGTFKNSFYQRTGASGSNGATTVTVTDVTGVAVNDYVYGLNVGSLAKVQSINSGTNTLTLTVANSGAVSGTLVFSQWPNITGLPTTGFKMKVKIKTITANATAITYLRLFFRSTTTTRDNLYPQNLTTLTLTGLVSGSDISIRGTGVLGTALTNVDANSGTTYAYTYNYVAGTAVDIYIYKAGYKAYEINNYTLSSSATSYPVSQIVDTEY